MNETSREQKVEAARSRLAELAAKFLDRTATDIASMRAALGRVSSGDAAGVGEIRHLAHRMVGTGATLGFDSLSECAHCLEQLAEHCEPGVLPDAAAHDQMAAALESLAREYQQQRR